MFDSLLISDLVNTSFVFITVESTLFSVIQGLNPH